MTSADERVCNPIRENPTGQISVSSHIKRINPRAYAHSFDFECTLMVSAALLINRLRAHGRAKKSAINRAVRISHFFLSLYTPYVTISVEHISRLARIGGEKIHFVGPAVESRDKSVERNYATYSCAETKVHIRNANYIYRTRLEN